MSDGLSFQDGRDENERRIIVNPNYLDNYESAQVVLNAQYPENVEMDEDDLSQICFREKSSARSQVKSKSLEVHANHLIPPSWPKHSSLARNTFRTDTTDATDTENELDQHSSIDKDLRRMKRNMYRKKKLNTQLLEAIEKGDINEIKKLLDIDANPNATCRQSLVSGCHIAALSNNEALSILISRGAESLRTDKQGRTPLHLAAWAGNLNQLTVLMDFPEELRKRVSSNLSEAEQEVAKFSQTRKEELSAMANKPCLCGITFPQKIWYDTVDHNCKGISVMLPTVQSGWTPLHVACARAQSQCVRLLLACGADTCVRDLVGLSPLDVAGSAYYHGHKIDVTKFKETVSILLAAGSKFQNAPQHIYNTTPLHTAVELESLELIEVLLAGGASPTCLNEQHMTPMHLCVIKRLGEHLKILANHEGSDQDPNVALVDAQDTDGYTVLHYAVKFAWTQGVCIALGAGADVTIRANDGGYPIHTAAAEGDIDIFQEILTEVFNIKENNPIYLLNRDGHSVISIAIINKHKDIIKMLLDHKEIKAAFQLDKLGLNVLHKAAETGCAEILEMLLNHLQHKKSKFIDAGTEIECYSPLMYAALNDYPECVEILIKHGADVFKYAKYYDEILNERIFTSPLHVAATRGYYEVARILTDHDIATIDLCNSVGRLPLHDACTHGNREIIRLLLHKGADLSRPILHPKTKLTAIDILMNNLAKPTAFVEEIFDTYISTQGVSLQETNCIVSVNYGILVPNSQEPKQLKVIKALIDTGNRYDQRKLLLHPLVQSFLCLKWKALLTFFYMILALYAFFVLSLNVYVVSKFVTVDEHNDTNSAAVDEDKIGIIARDVLNSSAWKYLIYVTTGFIVIQEAVFIKIQNRYFRCLETWVKLGAIILALVIPSILTPDMKTVPDAVRIMSSFALLLSWTALMFLLSRFPSWGFYVLMFGKVASKVVKILLIFGVLIFGFSLCFMIQFRAVVPFNDPFASLVKTMVMMTSEYDYASILGEKKSEIFSTLLVLRFMFLMFVIVISIVLMNLMVGVAVNDVNNLEMIGNIKRLEKQVEFLVSLEDIVHHKIISKIFKNSWNRRLSMRQKLHNVVILRPRQAKCEYYKYFPRYIREAIFEIAQFQNMQMDDEQGTMALKMKLNDIHQAIVSSDMKFDLTSLHDAINKINTDLQKIRSDVDTILQQSTEKHLEENRDSSASSNVRN